MRAVAVELVRTAFGLAMAFALAVLAGAITGHHSDSGVLLLAAVPAALLSGFVAVATAAYPPSGLLHVLLGLILAVIGFGILIGYGNWHQQRYGDTVAAHVVAERCEPAGTAACDRQYRLSEVATGADLGWVSLHCDPDRPPVVGATADLRGRPDGWYTPVFAACGPRDQVGKISMQAWIGLAGIVMVIRLFGLTTPAARMQAAYGR